MIAQPLSSGDMAVVVTAAPGARNGDVDVELYNVPGADMAAHIAAVRSFAAHLLCYAQDFEQAWITDRTEEQPYDQN